MRESTLSTMRSQRAPSKEKGGSAAAPMRAKSSSRMAARARCSRVFQLIEMGVSADVGILEDVLGLRIVAQERAPESKEPLVVAAHHRLEERFVALADAVDQLAVGQRAAVVDPSRCLHARASAS